MNPIFDQHLAIFPNFAPDDWCENIIDIFHKSKDKRYRFHGRPNENNIKDTQLLLDNSHPEIVKKFCSNLNHVFLQYMIHYNMIQYSNFYVQAFKFQQTKIHEGFHGWHCENLHPKSLNRTSVYTLYLNDVEEGGETEFLFQSKRLKPKKGTLCLFPASYTHLHRGNPPYSNDKFLVTGWINYLLTPSNNNGFSFKDLTELNEGLFYEEQILDKEQIFETD